MRMPPRGSLVSICDGLFLAGNPFLRKARRVRLGRGAARVELGFEEIKPPALALAEFLIQEPTFSHGEQRSRVRISISDNVAGPQNPTDLLVNRRSMRLASAVGRGKERVGHAIVPRQAFVIH